MVVVVVLAEDLILEFLLRLPPVSVIRFKCVCKSWYSLISNSCFLRNHAAAQFHLLERGHRLDPPGLLLSPDSSYFDDDSTYHSVYAIIPQDLDIDDQDSKLSSFMKLHLDHSLLALEQKKSDCFRLIGSCNGLMLYETTMSDTTTTTTTLVYEYKVFNPITNQYKEIPIMDILQTFIEVEKTTLRPQIVFDPSISLTYKVLTLVHEPPYTHSQLYVYSDDDDTGSWRLLKCFANKYITEQKTCMLDGVFYWLGRDALICFDVVKESVWFLPLPPTPAGYPYRQVLYFGECGGRLRLIVQYIGLNETPTPSRWFPCSFDILEMKQGSTTWTVKSRVNTEAGYDNFIQKISDPLYRGVVKVMHIYETEKGEEAVLLNLDYQKLVSFNITTNTFGKELTIPEFKPRAWVNAFPFTPTLFPLLT